MSDRARELKLELKDVVIAVKDVTEWYDLGLQLGLPDATLASIARHPDVAGHQRMMLSTWLQFDTGASWEKLAAALAVIGKNVIAENVRRQFIGAVTQVSNTLDQDVKKRECLNVNMGFTSPIKLYC